MPFNTYHIHFHEHKDRDKKISKIMASLEQFEQALSRIDQATSTIAERITELENEIKNLGLTSDQEEQLLARTEGLASALEAMGKSPENPVPEDHNGPVA